MAREIAIKGKVSIPNALRVLSMDAVSAIKGGDCALFTATPLLKPHVTFVYKGKFVALIDEDFFEYEWVGDDDA